MGGRRLRLAAVTAATILGALGALGAAGSASAAQFTAQPPLYVQSGAGPFEWSFESSFVGGPVAYKLSTEPAWHRCQPDGVATLSGLPEGRHSVTIADDDLQCGDPSPAPDGPAAATGVAELVVDHTPPVIPEPAVLVRARPTQPPQTLVTVSAAIADALSGVQTVTWTPGDGTPPSPLSSSWSHLYSPGTWTGTVTATDRAGNSASRSFIVSVPPRPQAPPRPPDKTPPTVNLVKLGARVLGNGGLLVRTAVDDRGVVSATGTVRIAGRLYALRKAGARLAFVGGTVDLHLTASARVRRAVRAALRRHVAVRAELRVSAKDVLGNTRVVRRTVRLRG
jgi:hypothetical protein